MLLLITKGSNECFKNLPVILLSIKKNGEIRKIRHKSRHIFIAILSPPTGLFIRPWLLFDHALLLPQLIKFRRDDSLVEICIRRCVKCL